MLELIINKYLDTESIVNLIDGHKDLREKIFADRYLIKNIIKKLFLEKGTDNDATNEKTLHILNNCDPKTSITCYNSMINFRLVGWKDIYETSYIGFLLRLYDENTFPCTCADNSTGGFDVSRYALVKKSKSWTIVELKTGRKEMGIKEKDGEMRGENAGECRVITGVEGESYKKEYYLERMLWNEDRFSIKLDTENQFSVSDLIFTYISKYDRITRSYSDINKTVKVLWPEWLKDIKFSHMIILNDTKMYLVNKVTNNSNIIFSIVHERVELKAGEYCLDLNKDNIYFNLDTAKECGENYSYLPCPPMEDMGYIYFKNDTKIDVLIQFSLELESRKMYISRKKILFRCKKIIGSTGCLVFKYSKQLYECTYPYMSELTSCLSD